MSDLDIAQSGALTVVFSPGSCPPSCLPSSAHTSSCPAILLFMLWNGATIYWVEWKCYPCLSPGPHLVAVAHEQLAEAGPVDHIRVEMGCLQCRDGANVAQMEIWWWCCEKFSSMWMNWCLQFSWCYYHQKICHAVCEVIHNYSVQVVWVSLQVCLSSWTDEGINIYILEGARLFGKYFDHFTDPESPVDWVAASGAPSRDCIAIVLCIYR